MDRGLRALLGPKEETVLRKIAAGADAHNVPRNHLTYLESLWLIVSREGKWELTDFGKTLIAVEPESGVDGNRESVARQQRGMSPGSDLR